jgi:hypothetical protein
MKIRLFFGLIGLIVFASVKAQTLDASTDVGCAKATYTFNQDTPNNAANAIAVGSLITIIFPAGTDCTTATTAGSSFNGVGIGAFLSQTGNTITFNNPTGSAVAKKKNFNIIIANVTNAPSLSAAASSITTRQPSAGSDNNSWAYTLTTTACPTVPANDNCSGTNGTPVVLTAPASGSTTCTATSGTTYGATTSVQSVCGGSPDDDVWYTFTATNTYHQVTVNGDNASNTFNAQVEVLSGACHSTAMTSLSCTNTTGNDGTETANLTGLTVGSLYHIRVYHSGVGAGTNAANSFTVCVASANPAAGVCAGLGTLTAGNGSPATPLSLAGSNISLASRTTCGKVNNLTSTNVSSICGSSSYYGGEDEVIVFSPTAGGNSSITLTSTGSWVGMMLYEGCPTNGGTCVASAQSSSGNQSIGCAPLVAGRTYYLVVDSYPSPTCNPFSVTITPPSGGTPLGTTCANPQPMTLPYTATGQSTLCFGNEITNSTSGVGTTSYLSGEDKVYSFTTTGAECVGINITNASTSYIGWHVFSGCPGSGGTLVGRGEGATSGISSGSVTVPSAGTYFLVVDTYAAPSYVNYDLSVSSLGTGPSNDLPCNATSISVGASITGENLCSGGGSEPAAPACWLAGTINTVWYSVIVPASGKLKINAIAGTLANPQIAIYTGTCSALTLNSCNDDASSCTTFSTSKNSELNLTGLANGSTIFIRVDGYSNAMGSFTVSVQDAANVLLIPGQDCGDPNPVCQNLVSVSNPGYSGSGNVCDLPTSYCLGSGERHISWYRIPISTAGNLNFNIVPNDFNSSIEDETDYDFAIWKVGSSTAGEVLGTDFYNCTQLAAGTAPPIACNYNYLGVTGVGTSGNAPGAGGLGTACPQCPGTYNSSGTYSSAYEPTIVAAAGDVYLLAVSNFSSSTSGFRLNFQNGTGMAVIDVTAAQTTALGITWSGGDAVIPTVWTDADNWGGCATPSCAIDTYIQQFINQPNLTNGIVYTTDDITIGVGATLTLSAGSTLEVCGNFTNNGNIIADSTSTIIFKGGANQTISGGLTGANAVGNLIIQKGASTGTVTASVDIDIKGSFSTANGTSVFNSNNKYIKLAGNFRNFSGNNTYTNTGTTGTLEFNGKGAQVYSQGATQLDLNKVVINNTAGVGLGVNLTGTIAAVTNSIGTIASQTGTSMFIKSATGTLTLLVGTITTGGTTVSTGQKVHVFNTTPSSVSTGNMTSFVDGNLRRYVTTAGDYNWPVGNVAKGYQRAQTIFSVTSGMIYIDSRFDIWPLACTLNNTECSTTYDQASENNGFWTMIPDAGTCTYDCTLYPLNATNTTGMSSWTIIKRPHTTAIDNTLWVLNGTCATSTATVVSRTGMTNFSFLGVDQGLTPLPIQLSTFTGQKEGAKNRLEWITSSERDNDYFTLEKSQNGAEFVFLAEVDGAGDSNEELNYFSYDNDPYLGITYYRLKQTNFDGQFTYSNIIALSNSLEEIIVSELYPNPTSQNISFDFFTPNKGTIKIRIFDNTGRLIIEQNEKINSGSNTMNVDLERLAKGAYTFEIKFNKIEFTSTQKLIKN